MTDEYFMSRAIVLAKKGGKNVKSNPNVGSVLVYNNQIIGEGFHRQFGGPHAEVNAINSVSNENKHLISKAALYVTLEPCCIHSKTPPCTSLIIQNKIAKVVISVLDPNPKIAGRGVKILKENGINVVQNILLEEGKTLIQPFIRHLQNRPYTILKWAQSANHIMGLKNERLYLTGPYCNVFSHDLRTKVDGILIGKQTAALDNPHLTTRLVEGSNPIRFVIDSRCELSLDLNIFNDGNPTYICKLSNHQYAKTLPNVKYINFDENGDLDQLLKTIYSTGIHRLLIEGGKNTLNRFIQENCWDEAYIFTSHKDVNIENQSNIKAPFIQGKLSNQWHVGNDLIQQIYR